MQDLDQPALQFRAAGEGRNGPVSRRDAAHWNGSRKSGNAWRFGVDSPDNQNRSRLKSDTARSDILAPVATVAIAMIRWTGWRFRGLRSAGRVRMMSMTTVTMRRTDRCLMVLYPEVSVPHSDGRHSRPYNQAALLGEPALAHRGVTEFT